MDNHSRYSFVVKGLDCPDCAASLEKAIGDLDGVSNVRLSFATGSLAVDAVDESPDFRLRLEETAHGLGYDLVGDSAEQAREGTWFGRHSRIVRIAVAGALVLIGFVGRWLAPNSAIWTVAHVTATIIAGYPVARSGWAALRSARRLDMNVLMTLAAVGAIAIGEYSEAAMTMMLFGVGELLEHLASQRAQSAITSLMTLVPDKALLLSEDGERPVPTGELQIGDMIAIRPAARVPTDAVVDQGRTNVDQSAVTGESLPVSKGPGDSLYGGTVNGSGAIMARVTRRVEDSTASRIMRLVAQAQSEKAPSERLVDRFARVYTPAVLVAALLFGLLPPLLGFGPLADWGHRALVMLVVACPCALVISTPVTVASGLARAAQLGAIIKGGSHLETLGAARTVAFDKTGTITRGAPSVVGSYCLQHPTNGEQCANCLDLVAKAASIERLSEHVMAQAVVAYADDARVLGRYSRGDHVQSVPGMGIEGSVDGHMVSVGSHDYCHRDGRTVSALCTHVQQAEDGGQSVIVVNDRCCDRQCLITVDDKLREGASDVVAALRDLGIGHIVMLTGDTPASAQRMAEAAGIDTVMAQLMPEDKAGAIADLVRRKGVTVMVGDGVNDAPALAHASVGVAMGASGTDAALETADVALMHDDLRLVPFLVALGRKTIQRIRVNIAFALLIKAVFIGLALAGVATLWMAVLTDTGASLLVTANGLRMLGFRSRHYQASQTT